MTWLNVTGATFTAALIIWAECKCLADNLKRERMALITITAIAWLGALIELLFPDVPGPIELLNSISKPLIPR